MPGFPPAVSCGRSVPHSRQHWRGPGHRACGCSEGRERGCRHSGRLCLLLYGCFQQAADSEPSQLQGASSSGAERAQMGTQHAGRDRKTPRRRPGPGAKARAPPAKPSETSLVPALEPHPKAPLPPAPSSGLTVLGEAWRAGVLCGP